MGELPRPPEPSRAWIVLASFRSYIKETLIKNLVYKNACFTSVFSFFALSICLFCLAKVIYYNRSATFFILFYGVLIVAILSLQSMFWLIYKVIKMLDGENWWDPDYTNHLYNRVVYSIMWSFYIM